ncbi:unnamed protein product [marine sediment metagenome]|uniref:Uncharacterized protein n=1 Tax=marine sediment metagenome TaxID=412755 RepID=X1F0I4_9ZZZZ
MIIDVEFIDSKGFLSLIMFPSKSESLRWLEALKKGTDIKWRSKNSVFVSQQYLRKEND